MSVLRIKAKLAPIVLMAASASCITPVSVRAQSLSGVELEQEGLAARPEPGEWSVALGAGLASVPRYQGADTSRVRPVPLILIRHDSLFLGPFGLGWAAINAGGFHAGPITGLEGGRNASDDPHLYGLGDIQRSLTGGVFATYRLTPFEISGTVRQAITQRSNGLSGFVRLGYRAQIVPHRWELGIGPHLDFANAEYEHTWFGVSPTQSEQSGLPVFTPNGGIKDVGLGASLTYFTTGHLVLHGFADINRLTGDSANSPIVLNRMQHFIGAGIAYRF